MARKGLLKVVFSTDEYVEDAADLWGPRREFFRLLLVGLCKDSGMLEGWCHVPNTSCLIKKQVFQYAVVIYCMDPKLFESGRS